MNITKRLHNAISQTHPTQKGRCSMLKHASTGQGVFLALLFGLAGIALGLIIRSVLNIQYNDPHDFILYIVILLCATSILAWVLFGIAKKIFRNHLTKPLRIFLVIISSLLFGVAGFVAIVFVVSMDIVYGDRSAFILLMRGIIIAFMVAGGITINQICKGNYKGVLLMQYFAVTLLIGSAIAIEDIFTIEGGILILVVSLIHIGALFLVQKMSKN